MVPDEYEHIRDSLIKRGYGAKKAKQIAAATWNKRHPNRPNPWTKEKKKRRKKR